MTLTFTQLSRIIDDLGYPDCCYPTSHGSWTFALSNDPLDDYFGSVRVWLNPDSKTVKSIDIGTVDMHNPTSCLTDYIDSRDADNIVDTDEVKRFIRIVDIA